MTAADEAVDFDLDNELEEQGLDPTCSFKLGGKVWHVKNDDLISLDVINRSYDGLPVIEFFREVLVDAEREPFTQMLLDPPADVTLGKIRRAMSRATEKILGFPTTASASSSATSTATPPKRRSSAGRSSSQATRRRASAG